MRILFAASVVSCKGSETASPIPVATVTVSIPRTAFRVGENIQAAALPLDASGGVLVGRTITWLSSNPELASVSAGGLVTGVSPGTATISAEVEGKPGSTTVQVSLVPVGSVTINPSTETVSSGATVTLTAVVKDSADRVLTGRPVSWTSSNPSIATVSGGGVVTGMLVGTAQIVATAEGKQGSASVTVNTLNTPVATVTVTLASPTVIVGNSTQASAVLKDANGNVLTGRAVTWATSDAAIATVSSTGLVTRVAGGGPVTITATSEGKSGSATVTVCAANTLCMQSASFDPVQVTVPKGTVVSFTNGSGVLHNIVFDAPRSTGVTDIGQISSGTVTRTFNESGTWNLHCTIHAGMTAQVVVP
jgi:trimeric autotransporter adhesin